MMHGCIAVWDGAQHSCQARHIAAPGNAAGAGGPVADAVMVWRDALRVTPWAVRDTYPTGLNA